MFKSERKLTNLSKVRSTCEQLPNVGGGELAISTERVSYVTTDLKLKDYHRSCSIINLINLILDF
jgi:hypothetical protein